MSATYDDTLPTNRDWVRFLIGDTTVASAKLTDEEITAVLAEETATGAALKYFAAARCLRVLAASWLVEADGATEKEVDELKIKYGLGKADTMAAVERKAAELKARGAELLSPSPYTFKVL